MTAPPQGAKLQALRNPHYLQSSATLLLFFMSWGVWWSFFQIWLTNGESGLGLAGAQVGWIYSVNSVVTLVFMLIYGTMQDRLGTRRTLAICAAIIQALIGPFVMWIYRPLLEHAFALGVIIGSVVLSAGFLAAAGLLEALSERLSRRHNFEYGQARMWGSFGYAVVALGAGFLFNINPMLNFWAGSAFGVAALLVLVAWRTPTSAGSSPAGAAAGPATNDAAPVTDEQSTPGLRDMVALLKMRNLWLIIILVFFTWTFYTVFDQQMFPDFYTSLFESRHRGQEVYGMLNSAQVFLEAAMMGLVPLLMRRIGVRNTLLLGVAVMFLRIGGCAIFSTPVAISCVKMFHALEVPLCILPVFRYFTLHFNPKLSATLYMVGFQIASQLGVALLSPVLGHVRDGIGYQPTFVLISLIVAAAGVYGFFAVKKDDQDVEGDPFVREGKSHATTTKEA
ncbi:MFS transporter [Corynebacterium uberis]|uniref:MFS transporter n=1 Tax=Corynebacterium TaxID=1716 RepID=UPI001D09F591|nr:MULTISPECIES: MFS transporter [Corynebacterium]MCZ9309831.1 MFS transporter [Corynebacterium sp. c6VSa_13]UDL73239.1 MFS transporter [Corynebacterium uberis]UDL75884.1 MFS transporter [Corynebacterium uberis]UDL78096.1 MFS transporter [Corynebacterium uberis]UDL80379.1 MFS transporter [Corynebacterium uberis]